MNSCQLSYIPKHLHWDDKPIIPEFYNEELLYRRSGKEDYHTPFAQSSVHDYSVNRSGLSEKMISLPQDVLYNLDSSQKNEIIMEAVIPLSIKKGEFVDCKKDIKYTQGNVVQTAEVQLEHAPLNCNYAHSMLVFYVDGVRVIKANYDQTLGSNKLKKLRRECRLFLHRIVITKEILFP